MWLKANPACQSLAAQKALQINSSLSVMAPKIIHCSLVANSWRVMLIQIQPSDQLFRLQTGDYSLVETVPKGVLRVEFAE
jgi:hypothetical protein